MLRTSRVQALLFDIDGTLADSDDQAVDLLARRLRWLLRAHPERAARRIVMALETPANAALTGLDMVGLDGPLMRWPRQIRDLRGQRTRGPHLRLIEGVSEMLAELVSHYRMAIVTTRSHRDTKAFLDQHHLIERFGALVTRESTRRLKPHPAPIRLAARLLGIATERCVMIGDTTVDIVAARRAGALAVGVLCGFGKRSELQRAGAQAVLDHTALLHSLL